MQIEEAGLASIRLFSIVRMHDIACQEQVAIHQSSCKNLGNQQICFSVTQ
jgi:hypothetical protein